ncbi:uncharacterized protein FIBRA_01339 [Fibroporia radiculosa]|uniref:Uncharacterized protein n=1 Tax=Fibroporia radiculosa TaxID=599839 RepID=J4G0X7_9APHY|nr:uncharacterized protein FIBRA_01339 [Fibroporia radiculosa]CCL99323.1 predicted protein [Fibroporia radiculosa]
MSNALNIGEIADILTSIYLSAVIFAAIVYEKCLTSGRVLEQMFSSRRTSVILLLLNELNFVAMAITNALSVYLVDTRQKYHLDLVINIVGFGVTAAVATLRVFALTGKNWWISGLTLVLALVPVATNLFQDTVSSIGSSYVLWVPACQMSVTMSEAMANRCTPFGFATATRICAIGSDALVVASAWYYLYHADKANSKMLLSRSIISYLILRDGTIYFMYVETPRNGSSDEIDGGNYSVFLVLNVINIVVYWQNGWEVGSVPIFVLPISAILTTRLLLHLREACSADVFFGSCVPSFVHVQDAKQEQSEQRTLEFAAVAPSIQLSTSSDIEMTRGDSRDLHDPEEIS